MKKLNAASGRFREEGYINFDVDPRAAPDVLHDLDVFPYSFPDEEFSLIEADHVLDHLKTRSRR